MRSLNNPGVTIPGGFRWWCEDTKSYVPATGHMVGYTDFIFACKKHCMANNLPIGSQFEQQIQDQLCQNLGSEWCNINGAKIPPPGGWLFDIQSVINGTRTLSHWLLKAKGKKVEPAEAERRAAICSTCYMNADPTGCSNCSLNSLKEIANLVVGGATTAYDSRLKSCRACGCSLKAKIHLPLDILRDNLNETQMSSLPEFCWLK